MADRLIRDELWDSDRWLNLPSDTDRLAYIGILMRADSFGNLEAGPARLHRYLASFCQVKTPEATAVVLTHLTDSDMIRGYEVESRPFIHVPRTRTREQYLVRKCPPSPWCDTTIPLGKTVRHQGIAKNLITTLAQRTDDVCAVVGVGVAVGDDKNQKRLFAQARTDVDKAKDQNQKRRAIGTRLSEDWSLPDDWRDWAVAAFGMTPQEVVRESLNFADYWVSAAGAKARKADWRRTFKVWMRRSRERLSRVS